MERIDIYQSLRKAQQSLNLKLHNTLLREQVFESAKWLGFSTQGNDIYIDNDQEMQILLELALHYPLFSERSVAIQYSDKAEAESAEETLLFEAEKSAYSSLFRIISVNAEAETVTIQDILNTDNPPITITDSGFSQSAITGQVFFTQILSFSEFSMTSGVSFVFREGIEQYLLQRYKKMMKKMAHSNPLVNLFIVFYHLHKRDGIKVRYQ